MQLKIDASFGVSIATSPKHLYRQGATFTVSDQGTDNRRSAWRFTDVIKLSDGRVLIGTGLANTLCLHPDNRPVLKAGNAAYYDFAPLFDLAVEHVDRDRRSETERFVQARNAAIVDWLIGL